MLASGNFIFPGESSGHVCAVVCRVLVSIGTWKQEPRLEMLLALKVAV
jgi:hypothetical protein